MSTDNDMNNNTVSDNTDIIIKSKNKKALKMKMDREGNYIKKGAWDEKEDQLLLSELKKYNREPPPHSYPWSHVARNIPGRSAKQCRERFVYNLDPKITKAPWKPEEDSFLIEAQKQFGNSWAWIASFLPGRTENSTKTRFKSIQRAQRRAFTEEEDKLILEIGSSNTNSNTLKQKASAKGWKANEKWSILVEALQGRTKNSIRKRYHYLLSEKSKIGDSKLSQMNNQSGTENLATFALNMDEKTNSMSRESSWSSQETMNDNNAVKSISSVPALSAHSSHSSQCSSRTTTSTSSEIYADADVDVDAASFSVYNKWENKVTPKPLQVKLESFDEEDIRNTSSQEIIDAVDGIDISIDKIGQDNEAKVFAEAEKIVSENVSEKNFFGYDVDSIPQDKEISTIMPKSDNKTLSNIMIQEQQSKNTAPVPNTPLNLNKKKSKLKKRPSMMDEDEEIHDKKRLKRFLTDQSDNRMLPLFFEETQGAYSTLAHYSCIDRSNEQPHKKPRLSETTQITDFEYQLNHPMIQADADEEILFTSLFDNKENHTSDIFPLHKSQPINSRRFSRCSMASLGINDTSFDCCFQF